MSKNSIISKLNDLNITYKEYGNRLDFKYEIIKDNVEDNLIKIYFTDNKLSQIVIYFYRYDQSDAVLTKDNKRFKRFLDELDNYYNNNINWKGKWKSDDDTILVKTSNTSIKSSYYDILIIKNNSVELSKTKKLLKNATISF